MGKLEGEALFAAYRSSTFALLTFTRGTMAFPATRAMATSTPIIGTEALELPEYVGRDALLIPPESPGELAEAITTYLKSPELREMHGRHLLQRALRDHRWEIVAKKTVDVYQNALE